MPILNSLIWEVRRRIGALGIHIAREFPPDFDVGAREIIRRVRPYTMTSNERLFALIEAARYIDRVKIQGDYVECGVWRGGSSMAAALAFIESGPVSRKLHLFDTFEGMTRPTEADRDYDGRGAAKRFRRTQTGEDRATWCRASIEDVTHNMALTGYPVECICLVKGKVEATIPEAAPPRIAMLRLDTDWYESTRHEFEHLYPRLVPGGVLIIDDYGHWQGCRRATDEYFAAKQVPIMLGRIDYTGRIAIKPAGPVD